MKMRILVINGPNLNQLSRRDHSVYGTVTLESIERRITTRTSEAGVDVTFFQSNSEGTITDFLQAESETASAVIINPGALTHYGLSLREALVDTNLPVIEVHLSNIHAREEWRRTSVVAPIAVAQISGLGWQGYIAAVDFLLTRTQEA